LHGGVVAGVRARQRRDQHRRSGQHSDRQRPPLRRSRATRRCDACPATCCARWANLASRTRGLQRRIVPDVPELDAAELDYAFFAEYAQITDGNLTAFNASFIYIKVPVPTMFSLAIAGRVRAPVGAGEVKVDIKFVAPGENAPVITWQMNLNTEGSPVYNDRVGLLFTVRAGVVIPVHGLYVATIEVDGKEARTLAFEALPL
jgi:hypothetical protein